jgi:hypothetical protein
MIVFLGGHHGSIPAQPHWIMVGEFAVVSDIIYWKYNQLEKHFQWKRYPHRQNRIYEAEFL